MSGEFTYMRKYIVLDNSYTNIKSINPKGHGKIEVKGLKARLSLNVENAEPEKDYIVYFLKEKNGKVEEEDIGRIIVDKRGRSRSNIDLNLNKLEVKGFFIKEIDAILIRKGIDILIAGYIDGNNGSIEKRIKTIQPIESTEPELEPELESELEPDLESELEREPKSKPQPEPELESELEPEPEPELEPQTEQAEKLEEVKDTLEPIEAIESIKVEKLTEVEETKKDEEIIEPAETIEFDKVKDPQNYQSLEYIRQLNHKNQMTDYILNILKFFPFVQPLNHHLHGYNWWLIEDDGSNAYKGFLPYYNYLTASDYKYSYLNNSTDCLSLIKKYEHYLFGLYKEEEEVKYYLYGVPGEFTLEEYPFKGATGFNTWYESENGIGYWIIYIDPMSGKVLRLLNPMIPVY